MPSAFNKTRIIVYGFASFFAVVCIGIGIKFSSLAYKCQYHTVEWVPVAKNTTGEFFYDKQSVLRHNGNAVTVPVKHILSLETYQAIAPLLPELTGALYLLDLATIDCNSWTHISLRTTFHTAEGRKLTDTMDNRDKYRIMGYRYIPPNSPIEEIAKAVCPVDGEGTDKTQRTVGIKPRKQIPPWSNPVLWGKLVVYPPQTKTQASFPVKIHKDLPEFTFTVHGEFRNIMEFYPLSVDITDTATQGSIQTLNAKGRFDDTVCSGHDQAEIFFVDLVQFVDLNHDGYLDFRVLCSTGVAGMNWYATYLYKPKLKKFYYHTMLSRLSTVISDSDSQGMKTYVRGGSCDECREYFTITEDDKLILTKVEWTEENRDKLDNRICFKVTGTPFEKVKMYLNRSSLCVDLMFTENFHRNIRKNVKIIEKKRLRGSLDGRARGTLGTPMSKEGG